MVRCSDDCPNPGVVEGRRAPGCRALGPRVHHPLSGLLTSTTDYGDASRQTPLPGYQDFSQPSLAAQQVPISRAPQFHGAQAAPSTPYAPTIPRDVSIQHGAFIPPTFPLPVVYSYSPTLWPLRDDSPRQNRTCL